MSEMTLEEALSMVDGGPHHIGEWAQAATILSAEVRRLQAENARLLTTAKELLRLSNKGTHGYATYNPDGSIAKVRDGFDIVTDARKVIEAAEKGANP